MTMNQARFGLLGVFVLFLGVQLTAVIAVRHKMWPDDLQSLIVKLLGVYSVQLGVILGGIFAQPKGVLKAPPASLAWTAMILAILWNSLLVWRTVAFSTAQQDSASDLVKYWDTTTSASSFLIAGAFAFFFTKGSDQQGTSRAKKV